MLKKISLPVRKRTWSDDDIRCLRLSAAQGMTLDSLSKLLKKTPAAVRTKASLHGISLQIAR